ncbi:MAG: TonB-dependent receptor domain-containing protein [Sphingomicrobium sp.]
MRRFNPFILSTVSLAAIIASPAAAAAQQTKSDKSPPQALTSEQEVESGQAACKPAAGQPLPPNCTPAQAEANAITVTGTRIRRPNLESPLPVTSIGGQEFFQTGNVSVGDKLAELPSIRSTFTQANSTRFLGTSGLNLLDLRGLGTPRTLVLINGRRHVGGDVLNSGVSVDTNTIPTDLIDRVDVVTGGNSAVYGSDAIAGVVNFVLKQNYSGVQLRGQGGLSKYGDAGSYFVSALGGKNFAGGRGNVAVNVEYAQQDQYFGAERPWEARQDAFVQVDADQLGPDGPDRRFFQDVRSASFSNSGLVRFGGTILSGAGAGGASGLTCGAVPSAAASSAFYNCAYTFDPTGHLVPITGQRVGLGPTGSFIGGNGENFRSGNQFQLSPQLKRYNINLIGHFDITPAIVPFVEAKFARTDSKGSGSSGPAFFSGTTMADPFQNFFPSSAPLGTPGRQRTTNPGNREAIALNNPYLDPATRTFITNQILASGVNNCTFAPLTTTERNNIALGTFRFCERLNMTGLGNREEDARRDTYRVVGGIKGDLGSSWNYEVSANYGHLKERTEIKGNLDIERFLLAMDTVANPATGQIVCASQINASRAIGYYPSLYSSDPNGAAKLANDIATCTPINPFGGNFTPAQRAYLLQDTVAKGSTSQFDATAFISGDTGKFFNLWGGPIGVVFGAEYRTDNVTYDQDPLVNLGYTFYNAIPSFRAPKEKVKEAFGEISLPIFKDRRFLHELEIDGAARVSHYNLGTTGTVWAYNVNAIYSPFEGLRFRGNYARAVRAPNQTELFSPAGQNFAPGFTDPCSAININQGSQFRAANCAAAGRPAGYDFRYSQSLGFVSGGNPNLQAEKSDSYTYGLVVQPRFFPGFSASVDYYNIKVNNAIAFVGAQSVANACVDVPTFPNVFCSQFQRAGPGGGPHGEQPFQIIEGSLLSAPLNYAKLTARGIDTEIAYRHQFGGLGRVDTRLTYTHVINRNNYISATDPNFRDVQLLELGDPQDAFNWNTSLTHGRFTLGYQMRYISKMVLNAYEDFFSVQGRPPQNPDYADRMFYPSVFYHDVRLGIDVGPKYNFYLGADNLTNKKPPLGLTGIGGGSAIYDARGRFYYAGVQVKY